MKGIIGFVLLGLPVAAVAYGLYLIHPGLAYVAGGLGLLIFYAVSLAVAKRQEIERKLKEVAELRKMYGGE
jgi:hypothetical protein